MQRSLILAVMGALTASASPIKRDICGTGLEKNFHLQAFSEVGDVVYEYPLAAVFPAPDAYLQLVAQVSGDPFDLNAVTAFSYKDGIISTNHTARYNPNGDAVIFSTGTITPDSLVTLETDQTSSSGFLLGCEPAPTSQEYFKYSPDEEEQQWSICNGDQVDTYLGRKVLYWQGTDPSCQSVSLRPILVSN